MQESTKARENGRQKTRSSQFLSLSPRAWTFLLNLTRHSAVAAYRALRCRHLRWLVVALGGIYFSKNIRLPDKNKK
jgi:hypothetical protein